MIFPQIALLHVHQIVKPAHQQKNVEIVKMDFMEQSVINPAKKAVIFLFLIVQRPQENASNVLNSNIGEQNVKAAVHQPVFMKKEKDATKKPLPVMNVFQELLESFHVMKNAVMDVIYPKETVIEQQETANANKDFIQLIVLKNAKKFQKDAWIVFKMETAQNVMQIIIFPQENATNVENSVKDAPQRINAQNAKMKKHMEIYAI